MTRDLVSKRTRNAFREFLVGWTVREIDSVFESAEIRRDHDLEPDVDGARRSRVEQYYRTLDFAQEHDARRLLATYADIIECTERRLSEVPDRLASERTVKALKACLSKDGFLYKDGALIGTTPEARHLLLGDSSDRTITKVTRTAIFKALADVAWWGAVSEAEFLSPLYDLSALPSEDSRFQSMDRDLWQHRVNNDDWPDGWVFSDRRLDLLGTTDQRLLLFLCRMMHPLIRPDTHEARKLVDMLNEHLAMDGWEIVPGQYISSKPTFTGRRCPSARVTLPDPAHGRDVLSDEYVRELSTKCDDRLASGDLDGAVTVARTLLEAILSELELRLTGARGDHKGDLPKQFKHVAKLLRMDDQRPDLDDRFKDVVRGLVMVANGLAPLRNKLSDGHARVRKPAPHHARVVVNAAKTVSVFLVESYFFQRDKGLLPGTPTTVQGAA